MSSYYSADTHFGHPNIIRYCSRPFLKPGDLIETGEKAGQWTNKFLARRAAARMDNHIIEKWNAKIGPNDDVYHNGDFAYGMTQHIIPLLRALNGHIHFIWGNHDRGLYEFSKIRDYYPDLKDRIFFLGDYAEINIEGQDIVLAHYAFRVWNKSHHGAWHLFGHSHGNLADDPHSLSIDVGVDCHNYEPISFEQVKALMAKKLYKPIDHHGAKRQDGGGIGLNKDDYAKAQRKALYEQLKIEFGNVS